MGAGSGEGDRAEMEQRQAWVVCRSKGHMATVCVDGLDIVIVCCHTQKQQSVRQKKCGELFSSVPSTQKSFQHFQSF